MTEGELIALRAKLEAGIAQMDVAIPALEREMNELEAERDQWKARAEKAEAERNKLIQTMKSLRDNIEQFDEDADVWRPFNAAIMNNA